MSINQKSTGERLEFYEYNDVTVEHLHRYAIANDFVNGKIVLDIASGEGYGSFVLSRNAKHVFGVDIDIQTIVEAKNKYKNNNLEFIAGSTDKIPLESNSVDVVVSFETIEHHDRHEEMMIEIKRVLVPGGLLIMSSPDKKYYTDIPHIQNKFHVKELYFDEFKNLIQMHFANSNLYVQKAFNMNSIITELDSFNSFTFYTGSQKKLSQEQQNHLYVLAIASDNQIQPIRTSFFNGKTVNDLNNETRFRSAEQYFKNTRSYKFGNLLLKPFFLLKSILKKIC